MDEIEAFGASLLTSGCIWQVCVHLQSCRTQDVDSSIKFYWTHQMAESSAPPSSLASTGWVFPTRGKCAAWSSCWPPLPVLTFVLVAQISVHRFPPICGFARSTAPNCLSFPFPPFHHFRPVFPTWYTRADHTGCVDSFASRF